MCEADALRNQLRQYTQAKYTRKQLAWTCGYECVCSHIVRRARTPHAVVAKPEKSENDFAKWTAEMGFDH
jgi:uncharacterized protein YpbB